MQYVSTRGPGWLPDLPDHRDYTPDHEAVHDLLRALPLYPRDNGQLPERADLREYFGEVEDQQDLPTSAAHACVALVQYFERRSTGRLIRPSRLFVHQAARRLMNQSAHDDASLRAGLKALTRFGAPPETYWPYEAWRLDQEPDAYAFGFSRDYQSLRYLRLDTRGSSGEQTLMIARSFLAAGFPCSIGVPLFSTVSDDADIPFPTLHDGAIKGHALVIVGYDDRRRIRSDKGALLVRNSWGANWGEQGHGWLPYEYLLTRLAADVWTLLKPEWLASGEFYRPV